MENYEKIKEIGKGSYGIVWLVKNRKDKKSYVLKQIDLRKATSKDVQSANQEAKLLSKLKHPNIVSYKDSYETSGYLYIVMLFCEGGDLYSKIKEHNKRDEYIKETQVVEWFVQIAMAIQYMHERHILHRDLKTQNIFLTKNKIIKVGDLGIARVLKGNNDMATTIIGTPYYMSPELFSNKPYNSKSDIWALGCCVFEMATLKHAFNAKDMNSLVYKILSGKMPTVPNVYSKELINLIMSMLNADPKQRPSVNKILRDPYIRQNIYLFLERTKQRQKDPISVNASSDIMKSSEAISNRESNQNLKHRYSSPNFVTPAPLASPVINSDQAQQRRDSFSYERINDENSSNDKIRKSNPNLKDLNENGHISKSPSEPSFMAQQKNNNKAHSRNSSASSFQGRGDGINANSDSESEFKKPVPQKSPSPTHDYAPQHVPISKKLDQKAKPRVRISSIVSDIENEAHIQINDSSPRESYENRKKYNSSSNNSSGSSSVESVENNKIIVPKVSQPPKIISKPKNSNTPPIISVLNSDQGAYRNSPDPSVASFDNVAKNESARERRRLKLRMSAQTDNSMEAKPPLLKKIEKPSSRPQSGSSESRPRSSGSSKPPTRVVELSDGHKKQLPFKDSLKLIRDRNAIVSKSDDLNNKPKHSKSLSDLQQQNQIKANKSVPIMNDDSSSSSSEEPENVEEKKIKQEKKDKKEVDEFINLLNTTLRMNANKPEESEIDEFDDYEEDFIEEAVEEDPKNKKSNKNDKDDDDDYEEIKNIKNMTIGTLDATKRMQDRISLLEQDCIDGLGKKMFDQAYKILQNIRDEEIEPRLIELLGKKNFDEYAGKIWQFKFYKESENLSRR